MSRALPSVRTGSRFARLRTGLAAVLLGAAWLVPLTVTGPAHAAAATTICSPQGTQPVENGEYELQANEWNSTAPQCITSNGGTAWSVSSANFNLPTNGAPATYPSLYKGCHWGACTTGSNLPIRVSNLASATSSWSTEQPSSGAYDVAYDLWINSTPTTSGQPDGTEIMIWLNSRGGVQPFGSKTGTSTAAGYNWDVWTGQQTSWKIISYVLQGGGTSFSNLDIAALIRDATARGSVNAQHYLLDAEAGFEIWQGGQGLATDSFSFNATAGSGNGSAPSAPSGVTVTGTTSSTVALSWTASSGSSVTGYTVYRNGQQVGTTAGTSFTDTGLAPSTSYTYTVTAHDAAGNVSPASSPVSATTTGSTGGGGGGCTAAYHVTQDWGSGFNAEVTVTNSGTAPLTGWKVTWTWPGNQTVTNLWNGSGSQSGAQESVTSVSYNSTLGAGASTTFGLSANYSGTNTAPTPICTAS